MAHTAEVRIDKEHGENCTCRKLDPITFQPVIVDDECPGRLREHFGTVTKLFEPVPNGGRIIITWPAPKAGVPLGSWKIRIHDYDTGEHLTNVTGMQISIGGTGWETKGVEAVLTALVDEGGRPLPHGAQPVIDEGGENLRTAAFRYGVVEMRVDE